VYNEEPNQKKKKQQKVMKTRNIIAIISSHSKEKDIKKKAFEASVISLSSKLRSFPCLPIHNINQSGIILQTALL
jgi:hypothetical protein